MNSSEIKQVTTFSKKFKYLLWFQIFLAVIEAVATGFGFKIFGDFLLVPLIVTIIITVIQAVRTNRKFLLQSKLNGSEYFRENILYYSVISELYVNSLIKSDGHIFIVFNLAL